ncbi:Kar4p [Sugiyamaella lignohabitans]|uniref:Kar4p n=1 Tax=Sugiyamaella lignohabitans TaxID=796027 RepID=A0A167DQF9_9ASCO|nr:Kar4p [Sugiyamaella lignohabitans]ANB13168.1 Kar4p [Sugiyamaella lignohabitans]
MGNPGSSGGKGGVNSGSSTRGQTSSGSSGSSDYGVVRSMGSKPGDRQKLASRAGNASGGTGSGSSGSSTSGFSSLSSRGSTRSSLNNDNASGNAHKGGSGNNGGSAGASSGANGRGKRSINNNSSSSSSGSNTSQYSSQGSNSSSHSQEDISNFGNDYNDHFIRSGVLPQTHITNIIDPLIGYPKLQKLHSLKQVHNKRYSTKLFGSRVSPKEMPSRIDSWVNQGMNFDVVMINGCVDNVPSYETLISLPIQRITPRPSIVFLWVPSPALEKGRLALEHWGFRRSEDIVYLVNDSDSIHFPKWLALSPHDSLVKTSWHCLMGLKGTLRRSEDSDLINCNVDTDVIIESPFDRHNVVPEKIYTIVENFSLMSRRLHIVPTYSTLDKPVRVRQGWVVMSPDVMLDNFEPDLYLTQNKTTGYRVPVDDTIDELRPKTPPRSSRK